MYQGGCSYLFWDMTPPPPGSSLVGLGRLGVWVLTCSLRLPGTDPEEAILNAFRMFDPSGKGVVNKDE